MMMTTAFNIAAAVVLLGLVALGGFVAYVATSDSREARVYRRRWKEYQLKRKRRSTNRYSGTTAGVGASADDKRMG